MLVAAGIGITPMISMIDAHLQRGAGMPPLWLLYGSTTPEHTAFRDELDTVFAQQQDLRLHYFYSRDDEFHSRDGGAGEPAPATVHRGRITAERVIEVMRGNYLQTSDGPALIPWFESDVYVCGPVEFTEAVRDGLIAAGANPDLVRAEDFAAAAVEPEGPRRQQDAVVTYAGRRLEATWVAAQEQTLLELAEDNDLELPFDCRAGTCRTCECALLAGEVDGSVSVDAEGRRRVLICVSYPASDRVVVEPPAL